MGMLSDLEANALTIDFVAPREGIQRANVKELRDIQARLGDIGYPSGYAAIDEQQSIPNVTADGGTYTLTFNLYGGVSFTTGNLAFDDDSSTIQTAVDSAASGVAGYTAGDIAISGGSIDTAPIVVDYSGDSVAGQPHDLVTVTSSLTESAAPVAAPTATEAVAGQTDRTPWGILQVLGVTNDLPAQGASTTITQQTTPMVNPYYPSQGLIRALAKEAAAQDRLAAVETDILTGVGLA